MHRGRVLRDAQPEAFTFENVKGILTVPGSSRNIGGALDDIVADLAACGYELTWRVIDAADYGVPQHRHRVIILGRRGGPALRFPPATHADPARAALLINSGAIQRWATVRDAIADLPSPAKFEECPLAANHVARNHSEKVEADFAKTKAGQRGAAYKRDRRCWDEPAKTVRAQGKLKSDGSGQRNSSHQAIHPVENRQLTVREAARLQTFPDWYSLDKTFVNRYRIVGDAVPPTLARVIAESVRRQLKFSRHESTART